jgi:hypothetical protein
MENCPYLPNTEGKAQGPGLAYQEACQPRSHPPPPPRHLCYSRQVSHCRPCCKEPDSTEPGWRSGHNKK